MLNITNTEHFGLGRKIVANMTSESWKNIPHVAYNFEADITDLMRELKKINLTRSAENKITVNTLMLKVIAEGLKAAPAMNAHIDYNSFLVRGRIDTFEEINISIPMIMPDGHMMTVNVRGFEKMNLDEITEKIVEAAKRTGARVSGPIPLPTEKEVITILRAVHKYKDSREQFENRTHKRVIDILKPTNKTVEALTSLQLPAGVEIEIKL